MFILKIKTDNSAFADDKRGEIARILEDIADKIRKGNEPSRVIDYNGNTCGDISWNI